MEKRGWYSEAESAIFSNLKSSKEGLTLEEAEIRLIKNGPNEISAKKKTSVLKVFLRQFKSFIIIIFLAAAIISSIMGHKSETLVISIIIVFVVLLGFFEEYKASRDMQALQSFSPKKAKVLRDGKKIEVLSSSIVVGDIILLERGDLVPADCRLIEVTNLKIDESILTGESAPVQKSNLLLGEGLSLSSQSNMVFGGTLVLNGHGQGIVVEIGINTEIGKVSKLIGEIEEAQTPLQQRIDRLSKQISVVVFILCIAIFFIGIYKGQEWEVMLLLTLGVLVSGIPEGIPTMIAVALAVGVKKMAKQKAIIKRLPAVESLGATTIICTDKTGTLTQNKMVVENIYTMDTEINITGAGYEPSGLFLKEQAEIDPKKHKTLAKLIEIGVMCNNAELKHENEEWSISGESTEGALIVMAKKAGIHKEVYEKDFKKLKEHPFDPIRKCMSTVHSLKNKPIVYTKGAPEVLLKKCTNYLCQGKIKRMTKREVALILKKNEDFAKCGLMVLGLAYKEHKGKDMELKRVENGLTFAGLVSIRDPPEPNAKGSIELCRDAGIKVVMITGDNEITARVIATELGMMSSKDIVLTGSQLDKMSEQDLLKIIDHVAVFARTTPEHKMKIVTLFQKEGHIVAMTGDGVNDAPALKKADIGVAMGSGTEVAKEASEIVLLDDNFTTIVNAVREGRAIYSNIRKFIYFALVGGFAEVILMVLSILLGAKPVLTALMILFVNLVTGDLPSIGLCVEKPDKKIMKQPPRNVKEGILSDYLLLKIAELLPLIVFGTLTVYMYEILFAGGSVFKAQTMAFATLIFFELFHVLNAKSWEESVMSKRFFDNPIMLLGILASILLTVLVITWGPAQEIFGTVALGVGEWAIVILMASSVLIFREVEKTIVNIEIKERDKLNQTPTRR